MECRIYLCSFICYKFSRPRGVVRRGKIFGKFSDFLVNINCISSAVVCRIFRGYVFAGNIRQCCFPATPSYVYIIVYIIVMYIKYASSSSWKYASGSLSVDHICYQTLHDIIQLVELHMNTPGSLQVQYHGQYIEITCIMNTNNILKVII